MVSAAQSSNQNAAGMQSKNPTVSGAQSSNRNAAGAQSKSSKVSGAASGKRADATGLESPSSYWSMK
jgi:hypothetical protein